MAIFPTLIPKIFKIVGILVICLAFLCLSFYWMAKKEEAKYREDGECVITAIENYRTTHNRLPQDQAELGIGYEQGIGPFYVKIDSNKYMVYFGLGFDENYTYYSETKEWSYDNGSVIFLYRWDFNRR